MDSWGQRRPCQVKEAIFSLLFANKKTTKRRFHLCLIRLSIYNFGYHSTLNMRDANKHMTKNSFLVKLN